MKMSSESRESVVQVPEGVVAEEDSEATNLKSAEFCFGLC